MADTDAGHRVPPFCLAMVKGAERAKIKAKIKLMLATRAGNLAGVRAALLAGADLHAKDDYALRLSAGSGYVAVVCLLREHGARLESVLDHLHLYSADVQIAVLAHGPVGQLSVIDCARQGICPEALCVLLARQENADLATMLKSTQMLEPLSPEERAHLVQQFSGRASSNRQPAQP